MPNISAGIKLLVLDWKHQSSVAETQSDFRQNFCNGYTMNLGTKGLIFPRYWL